MYLSNYAIDDNQRVSVMADTAPSDPSLNGKSSNEVFLAAITYSSVSSVIIQCDKSTYPHSNINRGTISGSAGSMRNHNEFQNRGNYDRTQPFRAEYEALKMK